LFPSLFLAGLDAGTGDRFEKNGQTRKTPTRLFIVQNEKIESAKPGTVSKKKRRNPAGARGIFNTQHRGWGGE
jgi:hypothetical protein